MKYMPTQIDVVSKLLRMLPDDTPGTPRIINAAIAAANLFMEAIEKPYAPAVPNSGWKAWLQSDETGASSLFMLWTLGREIGEAVVPFANDAYPHDPSDLLRCVGLLSAEPSLRPHIGKMAECGPVWAKLAGAWDELEAMMAEELPSGKAPKTYARMTELIAEANAAAGSRGEG